MCALGARFGACRSYGKGLGWWLRHLVFNLVDSIWPGMLGRFHSRRRPQDIADVQIL